MSEERLPDGLLLRRYREGDEAAFAELRARHGRLVLATCRRETGDPALAEDAAQGVFLLLTRKTFDDRALLGGWLHEASRLVSRNLVRTEIRRRARERRAFEEFQEPEAAWNAVSPHLDAALAALKPGDREAVLLRFASDLSLAEVGRALGLGENTARMRVARALERMREGLRRAGVGVAALLLASLLSMRLADAEMPFPTAPPSPRAQAAARRAFPRTVLASVPWRPLLLAGLLVGAAIILPRLVKVGPPRLTSAEAASLFRTAEGGWRGLLEFADDATLARTKTAALVTVDRPGGGLRLVARYPAYRAVDTTTIAPVGGHYRIDNVGSHVLDGTFDLVRLPDGPAFVGFSPAVRAEVRLHLQVSTGTLSLLEEVRRGDGWRFRNRFDLRR